MARNEANEFLYGPYEEFKSGCGGVCMYQSNYHTDNHGGGGGDLSVMGPMLFCFIMICRFVVCVCVCVCGVCVCVCVRFQWYIYLCIVWICLIYLLDG
jgi:hypothetical protein